VPKTPPTLALLPLLLLPALAAAGPGIDLSASAGPASLQAHLEAADGPARVYVLVSHTDPLAGSVVDRIVPVDLSNAGSAEVTIDGLRSDVAFEVRVLDQDVDLPRLSEVTALVNGTELTRVVGLAQQLVGDLAGAPLGYTAYAYPFAQAYPPVETPRAVSNRLGVVGVASIVNKEPVVQLSPDGGHRFGAPLPLVPRPGLGLAFDQFDPLQNQVAPDGALLFLTMHGNDEGRPTGWTVARIDPVTRAITFPTSGTIPAHVATTPSGYSFWAHTLLGDGSGVLVTFTVDESAPNDTIPSPRAYRLRTDGTVEPLGHVDPVANIPVTSNLAFIAGGPTGAVFVLWQTLDAQQEPQLRYVTSLDGGRTWLAARNLTGDVASPDLPSQTRVSIDATGVVHMTPETGAGGSDDRLRYVRIPPGQDPVVTEFNGSLPWTTAPIGYVSDSHVVASAGRTWVFANVAGTDDVHVQAVEGGMAGSVLTRIAAWESFDGGNHFQAPHEIRIERVQHARVSRGTALLPDGRPLLVSGTSALPLFDPFPEPACAQADPQRGTPTPYTNANEAPPSCPDEFTYSVVPGDVHIQLFGESAGDSDAGHTFLPPGVPAPPAPVVAGAAASLVVGLVMASEAARYGFALAAASLFARLRGKETLRHVVREGIYDHVRQNPGVRFVQLRRQLGLSHGAAAYHLRVLERNRLVRVRTVWTRRSYFPIDAPPPAASGPAHDVVLDALARRPGIRLADVAQELGLSRQLVHYHLRRLVQSGRVEAVREGRDVVYRRAAASRPR